MSELGADRLLKLSTKVVCDVLPVGPWFDSWYDFCASAQIGNVLARATTNVLMIKDSGESPRTPPAVLVPGPDGAASKTEIGGEHENDEEKEEELARKLRRSLWVPDDISCPKTWLVAPKGTFPPPRQHQRGPFRVSELLAVYDRGQFDEDTAKWVALN